VYPTKQQINELNDIMYSSIPEITQSRYILENPLLKIDGKLVKN